MVYVHYLFLHLAARLHLSHLLYVRRCLDIWRRKSRSYYRVSCDCTLHPDCHCLHPNQLPVIQSLHPLYKLIIYLHFWCINRDRRFQFQLKSIYKIFYQRSGKSFMLLFKGIINEQ